MSLFGIAAQRCAAEVVGKTPDRAASESLFAGRTHWVKLALRNAGCRVELRPGAVVRLLLGAHQLLHCQGNHILARVRAFVREHQCIQLRTPFCAARSERQWWR